MFFRLLTRLVEGLYQRGQDGRLARESSVVGSSDPVALNAARLDVRSRVDVERADDRRIQALEVEDVYVLEDAGLWGEHQPARCAALADTVDAKSRRDETSLVEL